MNYQITIIKQLPDVAMLADGTKIDYRLNQLRIETSDPFSVTGKAKDVERIRKLKYIIL